MSAVARLFTIFALGGAVAFPFLVKKTGMFVPPAVDRNVLQYHNQPCPPERLREDGTCRRSYRNNYGRRSFMGGSSQGGGK